MKMATELLDILEGSSNCPPLVEMAGLSLNGSSPDSTHPSSPSITDLSDAALMKQSFCVDGNGTDLLDKSDLNETGRQLIMFKTTLACTLPLT
jgi:hypothetical protein